ncbi:hypothetical protein GJAV_G00051890 [Gymnothorax javanicus]|nr:hypothetical protein GJAV_G00051890 [Gymnothorax javanicus]
MAPPSDVSLLGFHRKASSLPIYVCDYRHQTRGRERAYNTIAQQCHTLQKNLRAHFFGFVKTQNMSFFKGLKLDFVKVEETVTVHWKQGSIMGFGGDRSQTYNRCKYAMGQGFVPVYIDSARPTPKQLKP